MADEAENDRSRNGQQFLVSHDENYCSSWINELEVDIGVIHNFCEAVCIRLQHNEPTLRLLRYPRFLPPDDNEFSLLGQSLAQNTNLKSLRLDMPSPLSFSEMQQSNAILHGSLTTRGMEALADGIRNSQVEYFMLDGNLPYDVQQILFQGIQKSSTIRVMSIVTRQVNMYELHRLLLVASPTPLHTAPDLLPFHLVNLSLRDCLFGVGQIRLLTEGIGRNKSISILALYNCSLTDSDISSFCHFWEPDSLIEEFDLRQNRFTAYGAHTIMMAVPKHKAMIHLALSENEMIGYHGIKVIGQDLGNTQLEWLCLGNVVTEQIKSETAIEVKDDAFEALGEGLRQNQSLQLLILIDLGMGPNAAQAIMRGSQNHANISDLGLAKNETIGYTGIKLIGEELANGAAVEDLNLQSCVSADEMTGPSELRIEAFRALAEGLRHSGSIKELNLESTGIDSASVVLLMRGVSHHFTMTKLSLANNRSIGHEGLRLIGEELIDVRLEELVLTECTMGVVDPKLRNSEAASQASQALVNGVKDNVHLLHIRLHTSDLSDSVLNEIEFFLKLNRGGRYLMRFDPKPVSTVWSYIFAHLEDNASQIFYFLKEQPWLAMPKPSLKRKAESE